MKDNLKGQKELEELPKQTMSKSMKSLEDIMAEYIANGERDLTANEQRLLDRQVHEKTGKHVGKFVNPKKPLPKNVDVVISADGDTKGQRQAVGKAPKLRKPIEIGPAVSLNAQIS